jgi:hypothetical protein
MAARGRETSRRRRRVFPMARWRTHRARLAQPRPSTIRSRHPIRRGDLRMPRLSSVANGFADVDVVISDRPMVESDLWMARQRVGAHPSRTHFGARRDRNTWKRLRRSVHGVAAPTLDGGLTVKRPDEPLRRIRRSHSRHSFDRTRVRSRTRIRRHERCRCSRSPTGTSGSPLPALAVAVRRAGEPRVDRCDPPVGRSIDRVSRRRDASPSSRAVVAPQSTWFVIARRGQCTKHFVARFSPFFRTRFAASACDIGRGRS